MVADLDPYPDVLLLSRGGLLLSGMPLVQYAWSACRRLLQQVCPSRVRLVPCEFLPQMGRTSLDSIDMPDAARNHSTVARLFRHEVARPKRRLPTATRRVYASHG